MARRLCCLHKTQEITMRELTDAELDIVGGGTMQIFKGEPKPTGVIGLVEAVIVEQLLAKRFEGWEAALLNRGVSDE
jgi:hypothetical protein